MNDEIMEKNKDKKEYSVVRIGLVLLFYLITIIALVRITSLWHIYNYFIAAVFLVVNMISSIYVIGFANRFLSKLHVAFYTGLATATVIYTIANIISWFFIPVVGVLSYIIINLIIAFVYLTVYYAIYSFGVKQFRK